MIDTVRNLWLLSNSGNDNVTEAAYQALSMFPPDLFNMSHFPSVVRSLSLYYITLPESTFFFVLLYPPIFHPPAMKLLVDFKTSFQYNLFVV